MRAIYDDHEFRNDWDAQLRRERARALRRRDAGVGRVLSAARRAGEIRYRSWRWGANVECFLLDCRRFRSANAAPDDAQKTMLGATQHAWLVDGVTRSTATFKLVFTSVPLDFGNGDDHWATFTTERDAMFAALIGTPGVLFVCGDQHWFAVASPRVRHPRDPDRPARARPRHAGAESSRRAVSRRRATTPG